MISKKFLVSLLKTFIIMQAVWYFIWYGRFIANGELVVGCVASVMFGYMLLHFTKAASDFYDKRWNLFILDSILTIMFGMFWVNHVQFWADIWAGVRNVNSLPIFNQPPFGVSPHLVIPIWLSFLILVTFLMFGVFWLYEEWDFRKVYHTDDYYVGKIFIDKILGRKTDAV